MLIALGIKTYSLQLTCSLLYGSAPSPPPRVLSLPSYQFKLETNGVAFDLRVNFFISFSCRC